MHNWCKRCAKLLPAEARFCPRCGLHLSRAAAAAGGTPPPQRSTKRAFRGCGLIILGTVALFAAVLIPARMDTARRAAPAREYTVPVPRNQAASREQAVTAPDEVYNGLGGRVQFMGVRDAGERIAFVCDWSEFLRPAHGRLNEELSAALAGLTESTAFCFIPCTDPPPTPVPARGMVRTAAPAKREAYRMMSLAPSGGPPDLRAGLRQAFEAEPDIIYLVASDGIDEAMVLYCREQTASRRIRIHILAVLREPGFAELEDMALARNLRRICRDSGGQFRWITLDRLRRAGSKPSP